MQWLSGSAGGIRGIRELFSHVDKTILPEAKEQAGEWLQTRPPNLVPRFATLFRDAFDAVFGAQHLTWRCFKRSCLASYATVGFLTVLWLVLFAEDIEFINPTTRPLRFHALL